MSFLIKGASLILRALQFESSTPLFDLGSNETDTSRQVLCHWFGIYTNCHHDITSSTIFHIQFTQNIYPSSSPYSSFLSGCICCAHYLPHFPLVFNVCFVDYEKFRCNHLVKSLGEFPFMLSVSLLIMVLV